MHLFIGLLQLNCVLTLRWRVYFFLIRAFGMKASRREINGDFVPAASKRRRSRAAEEEDAGGVVDLALSVPLAIRPSFQFPFSH